MFRLLFEDETSTYDKAVQALRKIFKRIDIEELRGIEFDQKMQQDESIEQLDIELQKKSILTRVIPKAAFFVDEPP